MTVREHQQELIKKIQEAIDRFNRELPGIEKRIYEKLIPLIKELDIRNGRIVNSAANLRIIGQLKIQIESAVLNSKYLQEVQAFVDAFNALATLQNKYFKEFESDFKNPSAFSKQILKMAKDAAAISLTESGIDANITSKLQEIIRQAITSGGQFQNLLFEVQEFVLGTQSGNPGRLSAYAKTYTIDALNTFSAEYNNSIAADLGFQWYEYVGSLRETSRELCILLTEKRYVHISEFPDIIKGEINGVQVALDKTTGLPKGMKAGTTVDNLISRRGGWRCNHQFYPVHKSLVPLAIRNKITK